MASLLLKQQSKQATQDLESFRSQLDLLKRALAYDQNFFPAYDALMKQYVSNDNQSARKEIKQFLTSMITHGESTAFAHFAMSNVLSLEGDPEAQWHIEQAYQLDSSMVAISNNLAWILAHAENPDLERAFQLASNALAQAPEDPRVRDTYATILLKQGKYEKALIEFKKTLETTRNRVPVHAKLAEIYNKLGKTELAKIHEGLAKKSE